jgi:hypothetical protein
VAIDASTKGNMARIYLVTAFGDSGLVTVFGDRVNHQETPIKQWFAAVAQW